MVEVDRGSFSLEPFLFVDGALVTWADAEIEIALGRRWLPIPSSLWRARGVRLTTTAFARATPERRCVWVRYRIACDEHRGAHACACSSRCGRSR